MGRKWLFIGGMVAVSMVTVGFLLKKGPVDCFGAAQGIEIPEYGADEDIVVHVGYTASYNHVTLVPDWVAWELTAAELEGQVECSYSFSRDPDVRPPKASREDYSHSGWDKGHMAPRADMEWANIAMEESYYFTNICPQDHEMNAGAWQKIERLTRRVACHKERVYVVCGPVFTTHRHGTIGEAKVQVPDAFFKALAVADGSRMQTVGFLMDNTPQTSSPRHYAVSVDSVEAVIGRNLFPRCSEENEQSFDWNFWERNSY